MIGISSRRGGYVQLIFVFDVFSLVFPETKLQIDGIVLNIDNIVVGEGEAFTWRVELFGGMGPGVSIRRYEVASVANVAVVEMKISSFDEVFKANSNSDPSYKFFDLHSPLYHFACIVLLIP